MINLIDKYIDYTQGVSIIIETAMEASRYLRSNVYGCFVHKIEFIEKVKNMTNTLSIYII